ncbi:hypothetical protein WBP07_03540 [Novosphingobium sp. BL-8A]|uniref:hypothetical protein n=1 Tax=Novosphingobium sp. BL-8A TaxID=3127639 RepID=UPI003756D628
MLLLAVLIAFLVAPAVVAGLFARRRRHWRRWKIVLLAAGPLPGLLALPFLLVLAVSLMAAPSQCRAGNCQRDRDAGLWGLAFAMGGFVGGVLTASSAVYLGRRNVPDPEADIFT